MEILNNKKELVNLQETHNALVKERYKVLDLDTFGNYLYREGTEANEENGLCLSYVEIPNNETLSGHAEILDW